ncbi:MAG: hypothetical protein AB7P03_05350 [Kofleriaceae bacterium]
MGLALATLFGLMIGAPAPAHAGRKRVVVLEFEGPAAAKFHKQVVKLIKKSHTVVPTDKWMRTADKLNVSGITDKNVKKVSAKLKVDAVVQGRIEKRRNAYLIHLKLRSGKLGAVVGNQVDTKATGTKITGRAAKEIRSELIEVIADISSAKPSRRGDEDEEEVEDDEEPVAKAKGKKGNDDEAEAAEDDEDPVGKGKKRFAKRNEEATAGDNVGAGDDEEAAESDAEDKQVAAKDDDESDDEEDDDAGKLTESASAGGGPADPLSPAERAVDLQVGVPFTRRSLSWAVAGDVMDKPPPYNGAPVPGILVDATVYPLAFGHKRKGFLKNIGLTLMYDRVLLLKSKDTTTNMELATSASRYAVGVALRFPLGAAAVVGATVRYGKQSFSIDGMTGVPNTAYTIIDPMAFVDYSLSKNLVLGASAGYMLVRGTGTIGQGDQYGPGGAKGFEGDVGVSYRLTNSLWLTGAFRFSRVTLTFNGTGAQTNADADMEQEVFGAVDTNLGGALTLGYAM